MTELSADFEVTLTATCCQECVSAKDRTCGHIDICPTKTTMESPVGLQPCPHTHTHRLGESESMHVLSAQARSFSNQLQVRVETPYTSEQEDEREKESGKGKKGGTFRERAGWSLPAAGRWRAEWVALCVLRVSQ